MYFFIYTWHVKHFCIWCNNNVLWSYAYLVIVIKMCKPLCGRGKGYHSMLICIMGFIQVRKKENIHNIIITIFTPCSVLELAVRPSGILSCRSGNYLKNSTQRLSVWPIILMFPRRQRELQFVHQSAKKTEVTYNLHDFEQAHKWTWRLLEIRFAACRVVSEKKKIHFSGITGKLTLTF